ncbi:hypothetical protein AYI68_g174 [Smittium mucronatum]|uniref:CHY-type domain-containing protein n=1 Tax=Smittium mucronatum TaxID=133383 RepID=A0A1R0H902_9FUNG|nr:hypothetical protein AYI68_g174 [Smittium mucronatum]
MCKHILNAQVSIRAPCCKKWFDCPQCHQEKSNHELLRSNELVLACKKCKKVFRKDTEVIEDSDEADEYCPFCDNHYVIEAKIPKMGLGVEGEDLRIDNRFAKDDRIKESKLRSIFNPSDLDYRLG